jgi:hypothetical protein
LIVSEEICGRFGSFDGSASSYRLTRDFGPDYVRSASLFERLSVFSENLKYIKQKTVPSFAGGDDVQRFERQG